VIGSKEVVVGWIEIEEKEEEREEKDMTGGLYLRR
jgi:hypothetical protein